MQSEEREARKLLSESFAAFTEGLETRDLKRAKELLTSL
jgi:hypothetical protein